MVSELKRPCGEDESSPLWLQILPRVILEGESGKLRVSEMAAGMIEVV